MRYQMKSPPGSLSRSPSSEALARCEQAFTRHAKRCLEPRGLETQDRAVEAQVERFLQAPAAETKEVASRASRLLLRSIRTPSRHHAFGSSLMLAVERQIRASIPGYDAALQWVTEMTPPSQQNSFSALMKPFITVTVRQKFLARLLTVDELKAFEASRPRIEAKIDKRFGCFSPAQIETIILLSALDSAEIELLREMPCVAQLSMGNERLMDAMQTQPIPYDDVVAMVKRAENSVNSTRGQRRYPAALAEDQQYEKLLFAIDARTLIGEDICCAPQIGQLAETSKQLAIDWTLSVMKPLLVQSFADLDLDALGSYLSRPEVQRVRKKQDTLVQKPMKFFEEEVFSLVEQISLGS